MVESSYDALSERLLADDDTLSDSNYSEGTREAAGVNGTNGWRGLLRTPKIWMSPSHPFYKQSISKPSILSSTYGLTSTIIGAGVLALPYAFSGTGVVVGLVLLIFTAILSHNSCKLLLASYLRTHQGSYDDLASHLFGSWCKTFVQLSILLLNLGGTAGYMLVVKNLLAPSLCILLPGISEACSSEAVAAGVKIEDSSFSVGALSVLMFGLVYPLTCLESLSSLQIIGKLGMTCAIFLAVAISFRSIQALTDPEHPACDAEIWYGNDIIGTLRALPLFAFSFVCHLNVLPVYDELRSRTPTRMRRVISQALSFVTFYYGMVGGLGYLRFCEHTPHNILGSSHAADAATAAVNMLMSSADGNGNYTSSSSSSSSFSSSIAEAWNWILYGPSSGTAAATANVVSGLLYTNEGAEYAAPPEPHYFPSSDHLIVAARIAQTMTCTLALPFILFPCRLVLHNMITSGIQKVNNRRTTIRPNNTSSQIDPTIGNINRQFVEDNGGQQDQHGLGSCNSSSSRSSNSRSTSDEASTLINDGVADTTTRNDDFLLESSDGHINDDGSNYGSYNTMSSDGDRGEEAARNEATISTPSVEPLAWLASPWVRYAESLLMLSSGFSVALAVPSITVIFGFMGSTLCAFICFILPASFYLKSISGSSTRSTREAVIRASNRGIGAGFKTFMAVLLLVYGLFVMVVGTAINVRDFKIANA